MRIVVALVVIIVLGGIVTAAYSIDPVQPGIEQMTEIKSTCAQCHSAPPVPGKNQAHANHRFLECSACHGISSISQSQVNAGPVDAAVCARCHSVPRYQSAVQLHDVHSGADCSICHTGSNGLASATVVYSAIRYVGIVLMVLGAGGLLVNYWIVRARLKKQR